MRSPQECLQAMRRIILASDFLMTNEQEQLSNLRWFADLLTRPLQLATHLEVHCLHGSMPNSVSLSRRKFFALSGIEFDSNATQFFFREEDLSDASIRYLSENLEPGDLIIGYELSEVTRRLLARIGVHYVDVWLHPVRYLDDILFAFSSNHAGVFEKLCRYDLDPEHYRLYADRYRISTYKGTQRVELPIAPGSALFIGQTLQDKAISHHETGEMLNLLHYREEFQRAGRLYSRVYYSRHPYVRSGDDAILAFVRQCSFAEIADWPAYQMLASPMLSHVFSISSSVVHEARYFGKSVEFLYRPAIELEPRFGLRNYASVYQEFVSGHFWSDVLSPLVATHEVPRIVFLDSKDKLRDMLSFYWSYRQVDKVEGMRAQLNAIDRKMQGFDKTGPSSSAAAGGAPIAEPRRHDAATEESKLARRLLDYDVISFDVFDTLLVRPLARPEDLFLLLQDQADAIAEGALGSFVETRANSRRWAVEDGVGLRGEEVPLVARYRAIAKRRGLSDLQVEQLCRAEEEMDLRLLRPRRLAQSLYNEALRRGKRVIVVSDTYYERAFIEKLLEQHGFRGYHRLYVSSDTGTLKHSGTMYQTILQDLGMAPRAILHVGDNPRSDVERARQAGIDALHLPGPADAFAQHTRGFSHMRSRDPRLESLMRGMSANAVADNPRAIDHPSFVGGSARNLGYCVLGPIFLGFARWLIERAIHDRRTHLYFLARDGHIARECYRLLAPLYPDAPPSTYLYASRRGFALPSAESTRDLVAMLEADFSPTSLSSLLLHRFGLPSSAVSRADLRKTGFQAVDETVTWRDRRLVPLVQALSPQILDAARQERALLMEYFEQQGLLEASSRPGIIDIGHNGTLQRALGALLSRSDLHGYYFATFRGIEQLETLGMQAAGYVAQGVDVSEASHPYTRYVLMFELVFLNTEGSFQRMERIDGRLRPLLLPLSGEERRVAVTRDLHAGVTDFVRDCRDLFGDVIKTLHMDPAEIIAPYVEMLQQPSLLDAELFQGVAFENVYSGRDRRYAVEIAADARNSYTRAPIWKEGAEVLRLARHGGRQPHLIRLLDLAHRAGLLSDRKHRKLHRDPKGFFQDSKVPLLRRLSKLVD
jgi:predicted HAD superfamily hydrolase